MTFWSKADGILPARPYRPRLTLPREVVHRASSLSIVTVIVYKAFFSLYKRFISATVFCQVRIDLEVLK